MKKEDIYFYFKQLLSITDDGFIIVNRDGIILDINEKYCNFLRKKRKDIIGENILKIIPNTKMIDVMEKRYNEEIGVHRFYLDNSTEEAVIVSRAYVEDENKNIIGGVAQVKFKLQSLEVARKITEEYEQLNYYKEEYYKIKNNNISCFDNIIGSSNNFMNIIEQGKKVAKTNFSVLLTGETGTGKELFAKAIHQNSLRANKPIININCAAIPENLLESELFGYTDGAFTGAKKGGKKGKFLVANGGTIFLDEIGDMPLKMQSKLLRVLQEKEIDPVGGTKTIPVDIRIISATKRDIHQLVLNGEFREDLYYRLNVVNIEMIPLRERRGDILELADHFLNKLNYEYKTEKKFSKDVKKSFYQYNWLGNIRELDNVIKSSYATSGKTTIETSDLPVKFSIKNFSKENFEKEYKNIYEMVDEYEKSIISYILSKNNWNCIAAANEMGIHRSILYKKVKKYNIIKNKID